MLIRLQILVCVWAALLVWTFVTAAFFRTGDTCLEAITVAFSALGFFASAENWFGQLGVLSFFECSNEDIAVRILRLVFATNTGALWTACASVFQTLAIELKALSRFTCARYCHPLCLCRCKGFIMRMAIWISWLTTFFRVKLYHLQLVRSGWSFLFFWDRAKWLRVCSNRDSSSDCSWTCAKSYRKDF